MHSPSIKPHEALNPLQFTVANKETELLRTEQLITEESKQRKQAKKELQCGGDQLFRLMVRAVRDYAIFALDPEGRVLSWNEGAERIKGYRQEEILGEHFSRFFPPEEVARGTPQERLAIATADGRVEGQGWRCAKDGTRFWADTVITAVRNETGELIGFSKVVRDLTERKRAEDALRRSEANLAEGQRISHTGSWCSNPFNAEVYCSQELLRIFGLPGGPRCRIPKRYCN